MNTLKKRIDSLGRIVLPKPIRDEMKLSDFDELELTFDNESIVLKKSMSIKKYKTKFDNFIILLKKFLSVEIIIVDDFSIISSTNEDVKFENLKDLESDTEMYVEKTPLIFNSNILGYVYFVFKSKSFESKNILKEIKNILIDLIN